MRVFILVFLVVAVISLHQLSENMIGGFEHAGGSIDGNWELRSSFDNKLLEAFGMKKRDYVGSEDKDPSKSDFQTGRTLNFFTKRKCPAFWRYDETNSIFMFCENSENHSHEFFYLKNNERGDGFLVKNIRICTKNIQNHLIVTKEAVPFRNGLSFFLWNVFFVEDGEIRCNEPLLLSLQRISDGNCEFELSLVSQHYSPLLTNIEYQETSDFVGIFGVEVEADNCEISKPRTKASWKLDKTSFEFSKVPSYEVADGETNMRREITPSQYKSMETYQLISIIMISCLIGTCCICIPLFPGVPIMMLLVVFILFASCFICCTLSCMIPVFASISCLCVLCFILTSRPVARVTPFFRNYSGDVTDSYSMPSSPHLPSQRNYTFMRLDYAEYYCLRSIMRNLGLEEYMETFLDDSIDFQTFTKLTEEDIIDIFGTNSLHVRVPRNSGRNASQEMDGGSKGSFPSHDADVGEGKQYNDLEVFQIYYREVSNRLASDDSRAMTHKDRMDLYLRLSETFRRQLEMNMSRRIRADISGDSRDKKSHPHSNPPPFSTFPSINRELMYDDEKNESMKSMKKEHSSFVVQKDGKMLGVETDESSDIVISTSSELSEDDGLILNNKNAKEGFGPPKNLRISVTPKKKRNGSNEGNEENEEEEEEDVITKSSNNNNSINIGSLPVLKGNMYDRNTSTGDVANPFYRTDGVRRAMASRKKSGDYEDEEEDGDEKTSESVNINIRNIVSSSSLTSMTNSSSHSRTNSTATSHSQSQSHSQYESNTEPGTSFEIHVDPLDRQFMIKSNNNNNNNNNSSMMKSPPTPTAHTKMKREMHDTFKNIKSRSQSDYYTTPSKSNNNTNTKSPRDNELLVIKSDDVIKNKNNNNSLHLKVNSNRKRKKKKKKEFESKKDLSPFCCVAQRGEFDVSLLDKKRGKEVVASGAYGIIELQWLDLGDFSPIPVAIKRIRIKNRSHELKVRKEVEIMKGLRHKYLLNCFGCFREGAEMCIVTEYAEDGDLYYLSKKNKSSKSKSRKASVKSNSNSGVTTPVGKGNKGFDGSSLNELREIIEKSRSRDMQDWEKIKYLYHVVQGMIGLHVNDIVHRDLKTQNILICHGNAKICDFGASSNVADTMRRGLVGTPEYIAPECYDPNLTISLITMGTPEEIERQYGEIAKLGDIYSFGIIIWEVMVGEQPYIKVRKDVRNNQFELLRRIHANALRPSMNKFPTRGQFESSKYEMLKKLMSECWEVDAKARIQSFEKIKKKYFGKEGLLPCTRNPKKKSREKKIK